LAAATLKTLTRRRAVTLATTHLGALKQLAAETVGIVNASLQFDAETLTPTYRLLKGVPGRSYGLAIARRLGVAEDVLAEAERGVPDAERTLDRLLASVESRGREIEARAAELEARAAQLALERQNIQNLQDLENQLHLREKALDKDARDRARAYLLEARKTVEAALGQARAAVNEVTAREARRMVEEAIEKTAGRPGGPTAGASDLKIGERVRTGQGKVGVVTEVRSDGRVVVEVGAVRLVIAPELLERVDGPSGRPAVRPTDS
jgi:DNA mismatch repair protein MutS2